jgi:hypothetical protein
VFVGRSRYKQGADYPKVVTAADTTALIYMRGAFYDPAFPAGKKKRTALFSTRFVVGLLQSSSCCYLNDHFLAQTVSGNKMNGTL